MTKAEIYKVVLNRLKSFGLSVIDIDEELRSVLYDIATRAEFLKSSGTFDTVDGTASYDLISEISDFKWLQSLAIANGFYPERITLDEYQKLIEGSSSVEGEPYKYALWNDAVYFYPTPGDAYTVNVFYSKHHPNDIATIEFGEKFRECVYAGVLFKLWDGQFAGHQQATEQLMKQNGRYESELRQLGMNLENQPIQIKYRDI